MTGKLQSRTVAGLAPPSLVARVENDRVTQWARTGKELLTFLTFLGNVIVNDNRFLAMAPRLPLDVVNLIIDDLAKHNDKLSSIKACALVCHSYLLLCRKHIFASVTLNARQSSSPTSDDLNNLLSNSPHLAVYILNLDYYLSRSKKEFIENRILWLLPMFKKLVNLQSLTISYCSYTLPRLKLDWMSSLERKVLLPLLHLPTLTSISLATIENFPIADLAGCVNLKSLETYGLECSPDGVGEFLETLPPTPVMLERLFVNWGSTEFVQKSCHARRPDGKPIIDFSSLKEIESVEVQLYLMTELFGMCENLHKITLTSMPPLSSCLFIHLILLS